MASRGGQVNIKTANVMIVKVPDLYIVLWHQLDSRYVGIAPRVQDRARDCVRHSSLDRTQSERRRLESEERRKRQEERRREERRKGKEERRGEGRRHNRDREDL
jgi:hypothetical protein